MTPDEELVEAFERASALEGPAREAYLAELARRDPGRAAELRELLAAGAREATLLERPPFELPPPADAEPLPVSIGPYRILREVGRGGMGRVFLAEQRGEGFVRRVAVKRLDRREATPLSERRFRDEVKILAALEHPGIARFLDGGRDEDGSAYLALEYVEGADLVGHCGARALSVDDRLRLFLDVLAAVEYAHRRRVVHRDLKPANILVGVDGRPRLLDFGISKLLDPEPADAQTTRTELRALTPAYASPEQIRGATVTEASDLYSLGVVLYELLAGVRPFDRHSGEPGGLERAVLEEDPEPPSTAARRASTTSTTAAIPPGQVPADAPRRLGRDLDAICLKALRKEPGERYASAAEFAEDLRRFLAGRPVAARRGGWSYRAAKLVRRHRAALAAATAAAVLAAIAVYATLGSPRRPAVAVRAAPAERPTLARIGELSARFAEHPDRPEIGLELIDALLAAGRGDEAMGAVERLRQLPGSLGQGPRVDLAEARAALAVSEYQRAAAKAKAAREGAVVTRDPALGRRAALTEGRVLLRLSPAEETSRRMADLVAESETAGDESTAIGALLVRSAAERRSSHADVARALATEALARARAAGERRYEREALVATARYLGEAGKLDEGLATLEGALRLATADGDLAGEASALNLKMVLLNWAGRDDESIEAGKVLLQRLRLTGDREMLVTLLTNTAIQHVDRVEFREAEAAIAEAEPISRHLGSPRHRAMLLRARGYLDEWRGERAAARASYEAAIASAKESGSESTAVLFLYDLAWLEVEDGRYEAAAAAAEEASRLFRQGGNDRAAVEANAILAVVEAARGRIATANRDLASLERSSAKEESDSARLVLRVAEAKVAELAGDLPRAIDLHRQTVELAEAIGLPALVLSRRSKLALALDHAGRRDEAVSLAREILERAERLGTGDIVRECRRVLDRESPPST